MAHKQQILVALGVFFSMAMVVFFAIDKGSGVSFLQQLHTPFLDTFFALATKLGEEAALVPALAFLLWRLPLSWKERGTVLLKIALCLIGMFVVVVVLKQYVFNFHRPLVFFEEQGISLLPVEGVRLNRNHSFPSGHTATGFFAWFLVFNILLPHNRWRNAWFFLALLVGVSRIYLGQHFLQDVWFGSLIGYSWAFLALLWIKNKHQALKL